MALKNCDGPQKYDMKDPNDPWQVLLILTPAKEKMLNMAIESLPFSQENSTKKKKKTKKERNKQTIKQTFI